MENIKEYFENPVNPKQRQYEVLRGYIKSGYSIQELSEKYGYKRSTIYSLIRDMKTGKLELFPQSKPGPKRRRIKAETLKLILQLRMEKKSASQIQKYLENEGVTISVKTVERILSENGLLKKRKNKNSKNNS